LYIVLAIGVSRYLLFNISYQNIPNHWRSVSQFVLCIRLGFHAPKDTLVLIWIFWQPDDIG